MLTDFLNSFTHRLSGKFATNSYLNISPHLACVATLQTKTNYETRSSKLSMFAANLTLLLQFNICVAWWSNS